MVVVSTGEQDGQGEFFNVYSRPGDACETITYAIHELEEDSEKTLKKALLYSYFLGQLSMISHSGDCGVSRKIKFLKAWLEEFERQEERGR